MSSGRLARMLRDLTGRNDEVFVRALRGQVDAATTGAELAIAAMRGEAGAPLLDRMSEVERAGDARRTELIEELSHALTTPIDREDLFRVSRSIDDVLDNLRDFAREFDWFAPQDLSRLASPLEALVDGLGALGSAVETLVDHPDRVTEASRSAKKYGNELRRRYQWALADLFADHLSMDTLKQRDLLRRLDVVGLRLGEAADALADGAMKRSH